jgi:hypothetical protein
MGRTKWRDIESQLKVEEQTKLVGSRLMGEKIDELRSTTRREPPAAFMYAARSETR